MNLYAWLPSIITHLQLWDRHQIILNYLIFQNIVSSAKHALEKAIRIVNHKYAWNQSYKASQYRAYLVILVPFLTYAFAWDQ